MEKRQRTTSFHMAKRFLKPRFLIIGSQRCGTTSLYNYLSQHPNITSASKKEIHYFDTNYDKGNNWYKKHFTITEGSKRKRELITGEATPYYIFHPHAPSRVKKNLPDAKLIVMLRDPVERAFSHYKHHFKLKVEPLRFEEAIRLESERMAGEWDKMLQDKSYDSYNLQMFSYLARGVYVDQLKRWFEHFPREQILVLQSEDFFDNPEKIFLQALHFLGLPDHKLTAYEKFNANGDEPIPNSIRRYLTNYFKPHNERLYKLIGTEFSWPR